MGLLGILKFPLWLFRLFIKKPKKKRSELEQKQRKYVRNFSVGHYSWQKSLGKDKKRKRKSNANFRQREVKKVDRRVATKKIGLNSG